MCYLNEPFQLSRKCHVGNKNNWRKRDEVYIKNNIVFGRDCKIYGYGKKS